MRVEVGWSEDPWAFWLAAAESSERAWMAAGGGEGRGRLNLGSFGLGGTGHKRIKKTLAKVRTWVGGASLVIC